VDVTGLLADGPGPPLGQRRADVLEVLRSASAPLRVREVARRTGVHANTARFHLDALVDAGLATRQVLARAAPGRPSFGYAAAGQAPAAGHRQYRLLAEMLSSLIEGLLPDPGRAAAAAGREWGRYLTERPAPYQRISADEAVSRLLAVLAGIGFAPEAEPDGGPHGAPETGRHGAPETGRHGAPETGPQEVWLHRCPFREVAEHRQDVVCQLHLGLMQGVLDQLRAPVTATRIHPFAEPSLCIAELAARPASG
jgi:predicted ArsR family transcriptional regulator